MGLLHAMGVFTFLVPSGFPRRWQGHPFNAAGIAPAVATSAPATMKATGAVLAEPVGRASGIPGVKARGE